MELIPALIPGVTGYRERLFRFVVLVTDTKLVTETSASHIQNLGDLAQGRIGSGTLYVASVVLLLVKMAVTVSSLV